MDRIQVAFHVAIVIRKSMRFLINHISCQRKNVKLFRMLMIAQNPRGAMMGGAYISYFLGNLSGSTMPQEMMYLSPSSTLISNGITSFLGTNTKKPEVGLGVVET